MNKPFRVVTRLSDKENEIFKVIMARENLNPSETIRMLIREGAARRGLYAVGMVTLLSKYEVGNGNSES